MIQSANMATSQWMSVLGFCIYFIFRAIIHWIRNVIWLLNGTSADIIQSRSQERCAHVMKVEFFYKLDILTSNRLLDFITTHAGFEYPDYVLKDEVSLYGINEEYAIFVECTSGQCAWDVSRHSFSRIGQCYTAIRIIILPMTAAHSLAEKLGDPEGLVFMPNTARCGSTLMCHIFQNTGQCRVYSEPGVVSDLLPWIRTDHYPWVRRHMKTTISLMCKSSLTQLNLKTHVIKMQTFTTELTESLFTLYPRGKFIFMYRDLEPTLKSLIKIFSFLPYILLVTNLPQPLAQVVSDFNRNTYGGDNGSFLGFRETLRTGYSQISTMTLLSVQLYLRWQHQRRQIVAIKYEHLIQEPLESLQKIFDYCDVPLTCVPMSLRAFSRDALKDSVLSQKRLSTAYVPEFTSDDVTELRRLMEYMQLPDLFTNNILPGTITSGINE